MIAGGKSQHMLAHARNSLFLLSWAVNAGGQAPQATALTKSTHKDLWKKTLIVSTISLFEWEQLLVLRDMHDSVRRASAEINTKSTLAICYPDQQVSQRRERQIHQRVRLIHTVTHTHTNVVKHAHMYTHTVYFPTFELYSTTITSFIQARNSI